MPHSVLHSIGRPQARLGGVRPRPPYRARVRGRDLAQKSVRDEEKGEVRWAVYVYNQKDEVVATYELMTMNTP